MDEAETNLKYAFQQTLGKISRLYQEPEATSIVELVFMNLLHYSRFELYRNFTSNLSNSNQLRLNEIIFELQKHKPLQYVLGETEFYGLRFKVGPGILIPRPETEELVHWILSNHGNENSLEVLDIGTGSACIAIALAKNLKSPVIDAFDISEAALEYARENASLNDCNIAFTLKDILNPGKIEKAHYNIIVSNPPYIPEFDKALMQANVLLYEPAMALFVPGNDPLLYYGKILDYALIAGQPGGNVYFEIHENFGKEIHSLFYSKSFKNIELKKDINGKDRMVRGTIPF